VELPPELASALNEIIFTASPSALQSAAESLSGRYRSSSSWGPRTYLEGDQDVAAYAAYRMPATYAAVHAAMDAVKRVRPQFNPQSVLDLGTGPGTATWAAIEVFPSIETAQLVERDARMIGLGRALESAGKQGVQLEWVQADLHAKTEFSPHDLVIVSYALGEVADDRRVRLVDRMWAGALDTLLIVEPGTPVGFERVRAVRRQLIESGGYVAAPCPHDAECPMAGGDWCHFAVRLPRSGLHRRVKSATLSYEDEKYSYVAVTRNPLADRWSRVIRHPQVRSGMIQLNLCTDVGLRQETVTRRQGDLYRSARRVRWGDEWREDH
jgi:ribosomal protein RSM22 (predicted rRNA methylase)